MQLLLPVRGRSLHAAFVIVGAAPSLVRYVLLTFFFSSRRRHTIWPRDWSSDVCSSDLAVWVLLGFWWCGLAGLRLFGGPVAIPGSARLVVPGPLSAHGGPPSPSRPRGRRRGLRARPRPRPRDRKSTRLNSSHVAISYAVFCLKKKNKN